MVFVCYRHQLFSKKCHSKPCPNGVASRSKFSACVYLRLRLAWPCVQLALTCDDLRSLWWRSNLHASRRKFFIRRLATQPKSTQVEWRPLTYHQPMKYRICLPLTEGFLRLLCTCEEPCESIWPPKASLYASSTCGYLRLLASPFDQGFRLMCLVKKRKIRFRILSDLRTQYWILLQKRTLRFYSSTYNRLTDKCSSPHGWIQDRENYFDDFLFTELSFHLSSINAVKSFAVSSIKLHARFRHSVSVLLLTKECQLFKKKHFSF